MARLCRCVLHFVVALACQGQTATPATVDVAPPPSARFAATWYPPDSNTSYTAAPDVGAPYTATLVTTFRFLNPASGKLEIVSRGTLRARDGAGRKRDEELNPRPDGHGGVVMAHEVSVSDPVSHCSFRWMEPWAAPGEPTAIATCMTRTLHLQAQNLFADTMAASPTETKSADTVDRSEPLGKRMYGDVEAMGAMRIRTVTDQATGRVQRTETEVWYSPSLKEMLEMKSIPDPNASPAAATIPDFKLTNIKRVEPDPALFYPPRGYMIKPGNQGPRD
jgi:hypothetical protein